MTIYMVMGSAPPTGLDIPTSEHFGAARTIVVYNNSVVGVRGDLRTNFAADTNEFMPFQPAMRIDYGTADHLRGAMARYWAVAAGENAEGTLEFLNTSEPGWNASDLMFRTGPDQAGPIGAALRIPTGMRKVTSTGAPAPVIYNAFNVGDVLTNGLDLYTDRSTSNTVGAGIFAQWPGSIVGRLFGYQVSSFPATPGTLPNRTDWSGWSFPVRNVTTDGIFDDPATATDFESATPTSPAYLGGLKLNLSERTTWLLRPRTDTQVYNDESTMGIADAEAQAAGCPTNFGFWKLLNPPEMQNWQYYTIESFTMNPGSNEYTWYGVTSPQQIGYPFLDHVHEFEMADSMNFTISSNYNYYNESYENWLNNADLSELQLPNHYLDRQIWEGILAPGPVGGSLMGTHYYHKGIVTYNNLIRFPPNDQVMEPYQEDPVNPDSVRRSYLGFLSSLNLSTVSSDAKMAKENLFRYVGISAHLLETQGAPSTYSQWSDEESGQLEQKDIVYPFNINLRFFGPTQATNTLLSKDVPQLLSDWTGTEQSEQKIVLYNFLLHEIMKADILSPYDLYTQVPGDSMWLPNTPGRSGFTPLADSSRYDIPTCIGNLHSDPADPSSRLLAAPVEFTVRDIGVNGHRYFSNLPLHSNPAAVGTGFLGSPAHSPVPMRTIDLVQDIIVPNNIIYMNSDPITNPGTVGFGYDNTNIPTVGMTELEANTLLTLPDNITKNASGILGTTQLAKVADGKGLIVGSHYKVTSHGLEHAIQSNTNLFKSTWGTPLTQWKKLLAVLSKEIGDRFRGFETILEGDKAYTETIAFKIDKHPASYDSLTGQTQIFDPIQSIYLPYVSAGLQYIDTQVKFGKFYVYKVYAYNLVIGNQYSYSNPTCIPHGAPPFDPYPNSVARLFNFVQDGGAACSGRIVTQPTCIDGDTYWRQGIKSDELVGGIGGAPATAVGPAQGEAHPGWMPLATAMGHEDRMQRGPGGTSALIQRSLTSQAGTSGGFFLHERADNPEGTNASNTAGQMTQGIFTSGNDPDFLAFIGYLNPPGSDLGFGLATNWVAPETGLDANGYASGTPVAPNVQSSDGWWTTLDYPFYLDIQETWYDGSFGSEYTDNNGNPTYGHQPVVRVRMPTELDQFILDGRLSQAAQAYVVDPMWLANLLETALNSHGDLKHVYRVRFHVTYVPPSTSQQIGGWVGRYHIKTSPQIYKDAIEWASNFQSADQLDEFLNYMADWDLDDIQTIFPVPIWQGTSFTNGGLTDLSSITATNGFPQCDEATGVQGLNYSDQCVGFGFTSDLGPYGPEEWNQTQDSDHSNYLRQWENALEWLSEGGRFKIPWRTGEHGSQPLVWWDQEDIATATVKVDNCPSIKIFEMPYHQFLPVSVGDLPPNFPDVEIYPLKGRNDRVRFVLNNQNFTYSFVPEAINHRDKLEYRKYSAAQGREMDIPGVDDPNLMFNYAWFGLNQFPLVFKGDDYPTQYEVYRLETPPMSYRDFEGDPHIIIDRLMQETKSTSQSWEDAIKPNINYYYTFRSIDSHGQISTPSPIYRVQLVDNNGMIYPIIEPYNIQQEGEEKLFSKPMKKYLQIGASLPQSLPELPTDTSGFGPHTPPTAPLGTTTGDALWNSTANEKIVKVRVTSKQTNKKMDLNIKFVSNAIINPDEGTS